MGHVACDRCGKGFNSLHARYQHMNATGHWADSPQYQCNVCSESFWDEDDRDEHEIDDCLYCRECDRRFMNDNNMRMHRNSRVHRGTNLQCPFCGNGFTTATGLCHHLEGGSCPQARAINRDEVYEIVRSKDPDGFISKKLIGWQGSSHWEATDRAWNGRGYECYLCHRTFSGLHGLNQHLSSPAHQQHLYHCPNRRAGCGHDFRSLAALMNHLESESCGFTRFENVQHSFRNIISGDRLIGF